MAYQGSACEIFRAMKDCFSSGGDYMKIKSMDHELCDYDEAYTREDASDIGWCGKCRIKDCPYNKDLNGKRRMGWNV